MSFMVNSKRVKKRIIATLSILYLTLGFSWLFAATLNHRIALGPNLVSEYEGIGMKYAFWFRLFDILSALSLIAAVWLYRKYIKSSRGHLVVIGALVLGVLAALDVITVPHCILVSRVCSPQYNPILFIHYTESLLNGFIFFGLGVYVTMKDRRMWWGPVLQLILGITGFIASQSLDHALFALQVLTILVQTYWLWCVLFSHLFSTPNPQDIGFVRRTLAVLIGLVGVLSILGTTRIGHGSIAFRVGFGPGTAWLSQHTIIIGFAFLYLARQIYQGERTAHKIVLWLMVFQVVKYSAIQPRMLPLIIYASLLLILVFSKDYFIRHSSPRHFIGRLRSAVIALLVSVAVITVLGAVFRLRAPEIWEQSSFNAGRVVMRATLLEIRSNPHDPLRARIFGQLLTASGIAMYGWILSGLFSPALFSLKHADEAERERMEDYLRKHGMSSEDSFKLWPQDKQYWFNRTDTVAIAYKQYKGFVFALDAPVGNSRVRSSALVEFRTYCRQHGWKLIWLLADSVNAAAYEKKGFIMVKIGATAVVDLNDYAQNTVRDKWWRWIRNKNAKLGLHYDVLTDPIDATTMQQLRVISDAWLGKNKHSERTFALGYFDEAFLRTCTVHVLRDEQGKIVAFANQLPNYHNNTQTTIDLMRALPEYDGVVTYLLSETMIALSNTNHYKTFDLGFVPFAQNEDGGAKKAVISLSTTLLDAFFSAKGLRQFKNKFNPKWQDNYLAWDGDWLDLPAIAQAIDKVLTYEPTVIDNVV
jgi:phosphatidylglycerol lysyltransferase